MNIRYLAAIACLTAGFAAWADNGTFSVYHVGNSLTGDLFGGLKYAATTYENGKGNTYTWGVHFRPGTSLTYMYTYPVDPSGKTSSVAGVNTNYSWKGFAGPKDAGGNPTTTPVPWTASLPGNHWDAVTLQPYYAGDNVASTLQTDTSAINAMIALTKTRSDNAATRFYIYGAWPQASDNQNSYSVNYLAATQNNPNQTSVLTRDYFKYLTDAVRQANPNVALIPAGEVLYQLDVKMKAGLIPGFTSVQQLHRDAIHLNSLGSNIVAYTAYAVMFKESPVGLAAVLDDVNNNATYTGGYAPSTVTPDALKIMQETVWDVVTSAQWQGYTGVPEPSCLGFAAFGMAALFSYRGKRRS